MSQTFLFGNTLMLVKHEHIFSNNPSELSEIYMKGTSIYYVMPNKGRAKVSVFEPFIFLWNFYDFPL